MFGGDIGGAFLHEGAACVQVRLDFFIAGVQKAGTTALDAMLRRHGGVLMRGLQDATKKEAHFFDADVGAPWAPDYGVLHEHYDWSAPAVRGEATPIYLYWPRALERLRDYNPAAKIIVGLRHPSFRAHSQWRMETGRGLETLSFAEAIREGRARVGAAPGGVHRVFSYVERGFYDDQIAHLLALFPRAQVLFFLSDALLHAPGRVLTEIEAFLGLAPTLSETPREIIGPVESARAAPMRDADRALLDAIYTPRYARIEALTGLDLSDWRDADYVEAVGD
jgi:hypothetical protein